MRVDKQGFGLRRLKCPEEDEVDDSAESVDIKQRVLVVFLFGKLFFDVPVRWRNLMILNVETWSCQDYIKWSLRRSSYTFMSLVP